MYKTRVIIGDFTSVLFTEILAFVLRNTEGGNRGPRPRESYLAWARPDMSSGFI